MGYQRPRIPNGTFCALCQGDLATDVDHEYQFKQIVKEWLDARERRGYGREPNLKFLGMKRRWVLEDRDAIRWWRKHHYNRFKPRFLCKPCNVRRPASGKDPSQTVINDHTGWFRVERS